MAATQTERAIAWAKKQLGTYAYKKRCQKFVAECFSQGAGMPRVYAASAKNACALWRVSTKRSGIPAGAAVYFDSPTSPKDGHVGLCIGNDTIIHAFGAVKQMTVGSVVACGYTYLGWGWNGGVKPSGAGTSAAAAGGEGDSAYASAAEEAEKTPPHIPQTERIFTRYDTDHVRKAMDKYKIAWHSITTGATRDITDRVGSPVLTDDADALCLELSFDLLQVRGDKYLGPLGMVCGDLVSVTNTGSKECIFSGQVQMISGSYKDQMAITCHDKGRLLSCNEVIVQFNNCSAKTAIQQVAARVGIQRVSCPNLISSVYSIEKENAGTIIQNILATVTGENGVTYFPRMMGDTLVIRSYGETCIQGFHKQAANLQAFDILAQASNPQVSWDIGDLRNCVTVYSDGDSAVSVQATAQDAASIKRYGKRVALETFSDQDTVSASAKAKTMLATKNQVAETLSLDTYGSDKIVAGCRLRVNLAEITGEFWVTAVKHNLAPVHTMNLTLRRAT